MPDALIAIDVAASLDSGPKYRAPDLWFEQFGSLLIGQSLNQRTPAGGGFPARRQVAQSGDKKHRLLTTVGHTEHRSPRTAQNTMLASL